MCRMLAAVGQFDLGALVDGLLKMARDQNGVHELNRGILGTFLHDDGWGVAWLDEQSNTLERYVSTKAVYDDSKGVAQIKSLRTTAVLLHARQRTRGNVSEDHTHPFVDTEGRYAFAHNGTIKGLAGRSKNTDSRLYFQTMLPYLESGSEEQGVRDCWKHLDRYSGAKNVMLISKEGRLIAGALSSRNPQYLSMQVCRGENSIIVSSEQLAGIGAYWEPITSGTVVAFDMPQQRAAQRTEKAPYFSLEGLVPLFIPNPSMQPS